VSMARASETSWRWPWERLEPVVVVGVSGLFT
jgi:hypothetical protein